MMVSPSRSLRGDISQSCTSLLGADLELRTDSAGRPYIGLIFTMCVAIILSYLNVSSTGSQVFSWFSAISGLAFFLTWAVIIACHWRFRRAIQVQHDPALQSRYAFVASGYPWLSVFGFILILFMVSNRGRNVLWVS